MTNQETKTLGDDVLTPDLEALLKAGFVVAPKDFDSLIVCRLPALPRKPHTVSKIAVLCRWIVMTIGGTFAAIEVITLVFSFWAAGAAL
jgi:3-deoxy-D-manno-octulosonate 8-phosphate phosphatase KdsC-like HAD superfamily phosphatase